MHLQENKSACVLSSLSSALFFIGDKIAVDWFKDEMIPSLKAKNRLKFPEDLALNCGREKGKS